MRDIINRLDERYRTLRDENGYHIPELDEAARKIWELRSSVEAWKTRATKAEYELSRNRLVS